MKILATRKQGGIGDVICVEVALRALRARFPKAHITWAISGAYYPMWFDQTRKRLENAGPDEVIWPDPFEVVCNKIVEDWKKEGFVARFEFDGPEMRHQLETNYNLSESRIESWVKYVDCFPGDLCPHWIPKAEEQQQVLSWLNEVGIQPFRYIVLQWKAAETKKSYPLMEELVLKFKERELPIIVTDDGKLPDLGIFTCQNLPLRQLGCILRTAALVVGPDSFSQHFSAAVQTPSLGIFGPTNPKLYLKHYPFASYLWSTDSVKGKPCEGTFPCYGIQQRHYWCSRRNAMTSHCMESITPETIVNTAYEIISQYEQNGFYTIKGSQLHPSSSSLFFLSDPRVKLVNLEAVESTRPLKQQIRQPISVTRQLCEN